MTHLEVCPKAKAERGVLQLFLVCCKGYLKLGIGVEHKRGHTEGRGVCVSRVCTPADALVLHGLHLVKAYLSTGGSTVFTRVFQSRIELEYRIECYPEFLSDLNT